MDTLRLRPVAAKGGLRARWTARPRWRDRPGRAATSRIGVKSWAAVAGPALTGADARMFRAWTFAREIRSLAAVIGVGAFQRSCVATAGRSGVTSGRSVSASKATGPHVPGELEFGEDASSGGHAGLGHHCADRAAPSPSGSRPSRRTTVVMRRLGFCRVAWFFLAASLAACRAWRARWTRCAAGAAQAAPCACLSSRHAHGA